MTRLAPVPLVPKLEIALCAPSKLLSGASLAPLLHPVQQTQMVLCLPEFPLLVALPNTIAPLLVPLVALRVVTKSPLKKPEPLAKILSQTQKSSVIEYVKSNVVVAPPTPPPVPTELQSFVVVIVLIRQNS